MKSLVNLVLRGALSLALISTPLQAGAESTPDHFDAEKTRELLVELTKNIEVSQVQVINPAPLNSPAHKFIQHYLDKIDPTGERISALYQEYWPYYVLNDAGLYKSDEEKTLWQNRFQEIMAEDAKLSTNPEWTESILELGRLAHGLQGDFADWARRFAQSTELGHFPPEAEPWLNEIEKLNLEIDDLSGNLPSKSQFLKSGPLSTQVMADFHAGKISFDDATKRLEELMQTGSAAYGRDIAVQSRVRFNRIAYLRTKLAKLKGFDTWADYQIALQDIAHSPQFQGKEAIKKFLNELLTETDDAARELFEGLAQKVAGRPFKDIRPHGVGLLFEPGSLRVKEYFPKERHVKIWQNTMLQSGFTQTALDDVIIDAFPREKGKNSHAYMAPVRTPSPRTFVVDGQTFAVQRNFDPGLWTKPLIYILQNFTDDGIDDLETMFHEGGHALDYIHRRDPIGHATSNGYAETHSTAMEHFLRDPEFLKANGRTRDGKLLSPELIQTYIQEEEMGDLISMRGHVRSSLFDIELWDVDYTQPGVDFVDRAIEVSSRLRERASFYPLPHELKAPMGYSHFVTGHFYEGSVRYFGYVLAEVAASLVMKRTSQILEQTTGRSSLYNQPDLAKILIEGLYKEGTMKPFPESIESFIQGPYSPKAYAQELIRRLQDSPLNGNKKGANSCGPLLGSKQ